MHVKTWIMCCIKLHGQCTLKYHYAFILLRKQYFRHLEYVGSIPAVWGKKVRLCFKQFCFWRLVTISSSRRTRVNFTIALCFNETL